MKRIIKGILILLLCFGFVGCSGSEKKNEEDILYNKVIKKIDEMDYSIDFIDDSTLIICDSSSLSTTDWKIGIKVFYLDNPTTYLEDSEDSHVAYIRFYNNSYYDDLSIEDYDLDEDNMLTIYDPVEDYSKGEKNPKFYKDIPMYDSFTDFIKEIGIKNEQELIKFLDMFYLKKI